jgi:endonuclease-8
MPEGDTIFRSARALNCVLAGHVVTGFDTGLAKLARVNDDTPIKGRTMEKVESCGKWLLMFFSGDLILVTHMLMSGSWHIYRSGERWQLPRNRMRVAISTEEWQAVAFNVPIAEFHTARSLKRSDRISKLGLDILSDGFTIGEGVERLAQRARQSPEDEVGVTLLNQRVIAGLGNVYKSEVAFAGHVHPFRTLRTLSRNEMERLVEIAQRYMRANVIEGKGDGIVTYSGNRRTTRAMDREERLWVYGRHGQECRRCGASILLRKQGTQARVTYWCPQCQPFVE